MRSFLFLFLLLFNESYQTIIAYENSSKKLINSNLNQDSKNKKESNAKINLEINNGNLKEILIRNNVTLKILESGIKQSEALVKSSKSAWYPRLDLTSNQLPQFITGDNRNKFSDDTSTNQLNFGIKNTITWDLINPVRRLDINIAKRNVNKAKLAYESYLEDIYFEALKTFFEIKKLNQETFVADEALRVAKFAYEEAQNRYQAGIGNKMEVLEANFQLGRDEIFLDQVIGSLEIKKNYLKKLLNLKDDFFIRENLEFPLVGFWPYEYEESLNGALESRKILDIKRNEILINKDQAKSILAQKRPLISLYNSYSLSTSKGESNVLNPNINNIIKNNENILGVKLNLKLIDGGKINQEYNAILLKDQELESDLDNEILTLKNDLKDNIINLKINKKKIKTHFYQLKAAKESLKISIKRLKAGITTQREVVNLQRDVKEAETNYINSIAQYNIIIGKLRTLTGYKEMKYCNENNYEKKDPDKFIKFLRNNNLINCI